MVTRIVWFVLIGMFVGWLAGQLTKGRGFGLVGNLIVGVIGALVGGFLFGVIGLSATGTIGWVIMSTVGAVVFVSLVRVLKKL